MLHYILTSLPMFVCVFMTIQLGIEYIQHRNNTHLWLILWSVVAMVLYACHFAYFNRIEHFFPVWDTVYSVCNLLVFPLYLIYISEITDNKPLSRFPFVYAILAVIAALPPVLLIVFQSQTIMHLVCQFLFALLVIMVTWAVWIRINRFNSMLNQLYADTDDKSLRQLGRLLLVFMTIAITSVIVNAIGRAWFAGSDRTNLFLIGFVSIAYSTFLFVIGWMGLHQDFSVRSIPDDTSRDSELEGGERNLFRISPTDELPNSVVDERIRRIALAFENLMNTERCYLQPNLKLDDISRRLGTNRTYLLAAINSSQHMTFSEYVNRRRIAHAKRLMEEDPNISRRDIALRCGYNTLRTFYRNMEVFGGGI